MDKIVEDPSFLAPVADRAVPRWFWIAAAAALAFELFGLAAVGNELLLDPASLPADQRAMWLAYPGWMKAASAVAVIAGTAGAIGLLIRRRWAPPLLLVSLIALVVQDSAYVLDARLGATVTGGAWSAPLIIVVLCALVYAFARHSRRRGWLV